MKKKILIVFIVIIMLVLIIGGWSLYSRDKARNAIHEYMKKQGIKEENVLIEEFHKDWKMGGYIDFIYLKDENPDIFYTYSYDRGIMNFIAYKNNEKDNKKHLWGGSGVTDNELKYPPLKEEN